MREETSRTRDSTYCCKTKTPTDQWQDRKTIRRARVQTIHALKRLCRELEIQ